MTPVQTMIADLERWIENASAAIHSLRSFSSAFRSVDGLSCENCPSDQANFRTGFEVALCDACAEQLSAANTQPTQTAPESQSVAKGLHAGRKTKRQHRVATAKKGGASVGSLHGRLVDILRDAGEPMAFAQLLAQAKAPKLSVRLALKELAADGKVLATGNTTTRRFALVRGRKAAAAPVAPSEPVTAAPARMHYAGDVIDQALRSGDVLDKRAMLEVARKHFPLVEIADIESHLKLRVSEGGIERMAGARGDVYRAVRS